MCPFLFPVQAHHVPCIFLTGAFYVGNGWEWGNGMIIDSDYGSFPHSLLSTSKIFWVVTPDGSWANSSDLLGNFDRSAVETLKLWDLRLGIRLYGGFHSHGAIPKMVGL